MHKNQQSLDSFTTNDMHSEKDSNQMQRSQEMLIKDAQSNDVYYANNKIRGT